MPPLPRLRWQCTPLLSRLRCLFCPGLDGSARLFCPGSDDGKCLFCPGVHVPLFSRLEWQYICPSSRGLNGSMYIASEASISSRQQHLHPARGRAHRSAPHARHPPRRRAAPIRVAPIRVVSNLGDVDRLGPCPSRRLGRRLGPCPSRRLGRRLGPCPSRRLGRRLGQGPRRWRTSRTRPLPARSPIAPGRSLRDVLGHAGGAVRDVIPSSGRDAPRMPRSCTAPRTLGTR